MPTLVQHLRAKHTPSGNPQRLYMLYDSTTGHITDIIDEGYDGAPQGFNNMIQLPTIDISKSDYHAFKRIVLDKDRHIVNG
jgi:hypothetical protein|tara:strand:+ start:566 stop:808 length:243 start_codon:yes stop_codon:yes gene_type:complete